MICLLFLAIINIVVLKIFLPAQALNKKEKGGGLGSPGGEDSEHEQVNIF